MDNRPIGIFDSGVGGLTVLEEIQSLLPLESTIYLGDTARVPYGNRSAETIQKYARNATRLLEKQDIKALVIACNTASAYATLSLQAEYDFPVIGVIHPASLDATLNSKKGKIGVIGTRGTVRSMSYPNTISKLMEKAQIQQVACPLFVPLAEEGWHSHEVTKTIVEEYFSEFQSFELDVLILGCTHYPLLREAISSSITASHGEVKILDCASSTAKSLRNILTKKELLAEKHSKKSLFWATDAPDQFLRNANAFLSTKIIKVEHVEITDV